MLFQFPGFQTPPFAILYFDSLLFILQDQLKPAWILQGWIQYLSDVLSQCSVCTYEWKQLSHVWLFVTPQTI